METPKAHYVSCTALLVSFLLTACSSSGVLQVNPGEYMVSTTGTSPAFTGTEDAIRKAYKEATTFCSEKEGDVVTISLDKVEQRIGRPGRATLKFRCSESGNSSD